MHKVSDEVGSQATLGLPAVGGVASLSHICLFISQQRVLNEYFEAFSSSGTQCFCSVFRGQFEEFIANFFLQCRFPSCPHLMCSANFWLSLSYPPATLAFCPHQARPVPPETSASGILFSWKGPPLARAAHLLRKACSHLAIRLPLTSVTLG